MSERESQVEEGDGETEAASERERVREWSSENDSGR